MFWFNENSRKILHMGKQPTLSSLNIILSQSSVVSFYRFWNYSYSFISYVAILSKRFALNQLKTAIVRRGIKRTSCTVNKKSSKTSLVVINVVLISLFLTLRDILFAALVLLLMISSIAFVVQKNKHQAASVPAPPSLISDLVIL